jgi:NAD(P)-dependent dehydrogenase (short-subunit alcohol dehydrogenase family)
MHLTDLLSNNLKDSVPSRIVSVSSMAERESYDQRFLFQDWLPKDGQLRGSYEDGTAHGQSKLANVLYTKALAEKLEGTGVTAYSLHPGPRSDPDGTGSIHGCRDGCRHSIKKLFRTVHCGAFCGLVQFYHDVVKGWSIESALLINSPSFGT